MSGKRTTVRYDRLADIPAPESLPERVKKLSDAEIAEAVADDPDAAPIAERSWFEKAELVMPETKERVSIRLDRGVLEWFRAQGKGYQTRINAVLRAYVDAQRSR